MFSCCGTRDMYFSICCRRSLDSSMLYFSANCVPLSNETMYLYRKCRVPDKKIGVGFLFQLWLQPSYSEFASFSALQLAQVPTVPELPGQSRIWRLCPLSRPDSAIYLKCSGFSRLLLLSWELNNTGTMAWELKSWTQFSFMHSAVLSI